MVSHERLKLLYTDDDSIAQNEVLNGLLAAKQYARNKTKLSPSTQQELLDASFPSLPDGDDAKLLTEDECLQLRTSMQDLASERTTRSIANLRAQLAEYHSLLDELSSVTARYEALEETCQERGYRIQELEREVVVLKRSCRGAASSRRRVSCAEDQASRGGRGGNHAPAPVFSGQVFSGQVFSGQAPLKAMQGMCGSTTAHFQPSSSSIDHQCKTPGTLEGCSCDDDHTYRMEPYRQTQNSFYDMIDLMQGRHISPGPSPAIGPLPFEGSVHTDIFTSSNFSPDSDCGNGLKRVDGFLDARNKRAISYGCVTSSSDMMLDQQQGTKRSKSNVFSHPEFVGHCFQPPNVT